MKKQILTSVLSIVVGVNYLPAFANTKNLESKQVSSSNILPNSKLSDIKQQPTLVALEYKSPDNDYTVKMPGIVVKNTANLLMSITDKGDVYAIAYDNLAVDHCDSQRYDLVNKIALNYAMEERATILSKKYSNRHSDSNKA